MALQQISVDEYFHGVLSNHCCSGYSCKSLFVWIWPSQHAAYTRYACFISLQMAIQIQYFVTSHRSQVGIMKNTTG